MSVFYLPRDDLALVAESEEAYGYRALEIPDGIRGRGHSHVELWIIRLRVVS